MIQKNVPMGPIFSRCALAFLLCLGPSCGNSKHARLSPGALPVIAQDLSGLWNFALTLLQSSCEGDEEGTTNTVEVTFRETTRSGSAADERVYEIQIPAFGPAPFTAVQEGDRVTITGMIEDGGFMEAFTFDLTLLANALELVGQKTGNIIEAGVPCELLEDVLSTFVPAATAACGDAVQGDLEGRYCAEGVRVSIPDSNLPACSDGGGLPDQVSFEFEVFRVPDGKGRGALGGVVLTADLTGVFGVPGREYPGSFERFGMDVYIVAGGTVSLPGGGGLVPATEFHDIAFKITVHQDGSHRGEVTDHVRSSVPKGNVTPVFECGSSIEFEGVRLGGVLGERPLSD